MPLQSPPPHHKPVRATCCLGGRSMKGERFWVFSSSPRLAKVSFYGLYLYNLGQVRILPYAHANRFTTVDVLQRLWVKLPEVPIKVISMVPPPIALGWCKRPLKP